MSESDMRIISDIDMQISVELGRTKMLLRQILEMKPGTVMELDSNTGSRLSFLVNNHLVAKGEVMIIDGRFALRVTDIVGSLTKAVEEGKGGK